MMKQVVSAYWAENFATFMREANWPVELPLSLDVYDDGWSMKPDVKMRFRTSLHGGTSSIHFGLTYEDFIEHAFDTTGYRVKVRALFLDSLRKFADAARRCPT